MDEPSAPIKSGPGLAIFDLDYTLTKRGTWGRFIWGLVRFKPHIWLPMWIHAGWVQWRYKRGARPRVDVKLAMMRWAMKGASKNDVLKWGQAFAQEEVRTGLRPGAIEAIKKHQSQGDILIIISAAVDVIAKPMGDILGFNFVLSTEMDFDSQNILKLNFTSKNCYGEEKVIRLNDLMDENPELKQYNTHVTFYSDSISDLAMFELATVCIPVHPDERLLQYASNKGWPIANW